MRDEQKAARAERAWPTVLHPTVCTPAQILQMGGIAQDDPYLADLVKGMALECDSLAFHWFRAQRKIAPIYFLLGKARAIVLILYTIALSSGKNVFSMTAWELATIIKVEPDYIGKLLTRYRPMLSRLFYFEKKYCTVDGKPFCEGYIWKVDLEREITVDIFVAQEAVKGDLEIFQQNTRNLEADILAGHTARAYQAKKELNFNTRGQVRKVTTKADLPQGKALEMLERCCARAAGIRPTQEEFQLKNSSSRYEVSDAVNAPVGHTRGEQLGWVRRLGSCLAAFLGGSGDLKLWFKVGWTALKLEATNILADVINEVIIRNQDTDQRNSSAIILAALFDRGLILQE